MTNWDEQKRKKYAQSGKSMGEFGPDYSYRKKYQKDYHDETNKISDDKHYLIYQSGRGNEAPSPLLKNYLGSRPKTTSYDTSGIEAYENEGGFIPPDSEKSETDDECYDINRNIKRGDDISLEEIKWRHKTMRERRRNIRE